MSRATRHLIAWGAACCLAAAGARADWLVTRSGERIETEGAWELKGRMVVFTPVGGTLSSMRASEVDFAASEQATAAAQAAAAAPAPPPPPAVTARPRRLITTDDIGEGVPGAEGAEQLVERLRQAHQYRDVDLAMGLVNWQDVPQGIRDYVATRFEWMMQRRLRDVRFVPADPDELVEDRAEVQDGVLYEPNVEVAGRIEIEFLPDPDQDELSLTFLVGTRLGAYFLAAPRQVEE